MNFIDSRNVIVKKTENKGYGVFTIFDLEKDDLIEKGIMQRIEHDGNHNPHLFSWSDDGSKWAFGSGCSTYYNTSLTPNVKVVRDFENDLFYIYALKNIKRNEELTHKYKSLEWRKCFEDLRNIKDL